MKTAIKKLRVIAILLLVLCVLAACGGGGDSTGSSSQANSGAEAQAEQDLENLDEAEKDAEAQSDNAAAGEEAERSDENVLSDDGASADEKTEQDTAAAADAKSADAQEAAPPEIPGLTYESTMPLENAECFNVYYYEDGYKLIDVPLSGQYLVIPEGKDAPEGLDDGIYKLYQPLTEVYMAATGSMSFIDQIGALDNVTMSSLQESGWYIDAPAQAMKEGKMVYAGKYSEPDYETLVGHNCDLAVESTMILHSPEVQEMIEDLGIPVFIDRCSYEKDAFGRIEWMKAYAAMFNKEETAEEKFSEQKAVLDELKDFENTGKTVAFFAVNSNKTITTRVTDDFIPNMIELAGGKYIFEDLKNPGSNSASVRLSFEEFYDKAVDADYLVYNGTIEEPLQSIDDLIGKNDLFSEFKAVKEGNVWTVDSAWYQSTATIGYLITDFNRMVTGGDPDEMVFLHKVD